MKLEQSDFEFVEAINDPLSTERKTIDIFLRIAFDRCRLFPGSIPFKATEAAGVIGWLRGLLDKKPQEWYAASRPPWEK